MTHLYTEIHLLLHMHTCARVKACSYSSHSFLNATAFFFTCDFVKVFTQCNCDLYRYILESHITITQNVYETHSMSNVTHTCVTAISILQSHHMNSLIDIHTTH